MTDRSPALIDFASGNGGLPDDAVRTSCSEKNCCLGLRGITKCVIMKGEKVLPNKKTCDCIIFHGLSIPRIILVELKSGFVNSGQIEEKFENTLEWMMGPGEKIFGSSDYRIILLLLHGRGISKSYYSTLRSRAFRVKGERYFLQMMRCGTQLTDLYKKLKAD